MSDRTDIKIFIASSGELQAERDESLKVIVEINKNFDHLHLIPVLFELDTASGNNPGEGRIQDAINPLLDRSDIVVVLFYSRVGEFTKEEFERAENANKKIFLYLKDGFQPPNVDSSKKYTEVLVFKEAIERESGIRYQKFRSENDFNGLFYKDLHKFISNNYPVLENSNITKIPSKLAAIENKLNIYPNSNVLIFYSYSHKDEAYKDSLNTHLAVLKRQRYLEGWNDRKIAPGENWEEEINLNLQKSQIVLLLVSSNFLASDYCYDTETVYALEQHEKGNCIVIPIILKPCLWTLSEFKHLQALPKNGKPISTWKNKDEAWLDVSEGLLRVIQDLDLEKPKSPMRPENRNANSQHKNVVEDDIKIGDSIKIEGDGNILVDNSLYLEDNSFNQNSANKKTERSEILTNLLLAFLKKFDAYYFSALRIQKWGGARNGFEQFSHYNAIEIKEELENLLKLQKVKFIISKKGNKIYKINYKTR